MGQDSEKGSTAIINYAEAGNGNPPDVAAHGASDSDTGTFARISKNQDYGLTITRLIVDLGEGTVIDMKELQEGVFKVLGVNKTEKVFRNITSLSVTDKNGYMTTSGRYVAIDLDFGFDSDADNAYTYIVTLNEDLGNYSKDSIFVQKGRTLRR